MFVTPRDHFILFVFCTLGTCIFIAFGSPAEGGAVLHHFIMTLGVRGFVTLRLLVAQVCTCEVVLGLAVNRIA